MKLVGETPRQKVNFVLECFKPEDAQRARLQNIQNVLLRSALLCDGPGTAENTKLSQIIDLLRETLEKSSRKTEAHAYRVGEVTEKICRALDLSERETLITTIAGYIHDIGKFCIPLSILLKEDPINTYERRIIHMHPEIGKLICENSLGLVYPKICTMMLHHHERWDGKKGLGVGKPGGYPSGLKGEKIPYGSRILAVADTYDALTNNRPHRKNADGTPKIHTKEEAVEIIIKNSGTQFDPKIVEAFLMVARENRL